MLTVFMVIIINQRVIFSQGWTISRSSVMANEVFPSVQAMMASASPMSAYRATLMRLSGFCSTNSTCLPSPERVATVVMAAYAINRAWNSP